MKPRRAALAGIVFPVIAVFYLAFQVAGGAPRLDWAGFTLLVALGAATSIMAYVLFASLSRS